MEIKNWGTINGIRFELYEKHVLVIDPSRSLNDQRTIHRYASFEDARAAFCKMLYREERK